MVVGVEALNVLSQPQAKPELPNRGRLDKKANQPFGRPVELLAQADGGDEGEDDEEDLVDDEDHHQDPIISGDLAEEHQHGEDGIDGQGERGEEEEDEAVDGVGVGHPPQRGDALRLEVGETPAAEGEAVLGGQVGFEVAETKIGDGKEEQTEGAYEDQRGENGAGVGQRRQEANAELKIL